jgi:hypothetical protein
MFVAAPLDPNPLTEIDKKINELRLKYRTFMVENDVEWVCILLFFKACECIDSYAKLFANNFFFF